MSSPSGEGKEKMEAIALACSTACGAPGQCPCNPEACSCKSTCGCKKEKCGRNPKPANCTDGVCPKPGEASTGDCNDKAGRSPFFVEALVEDFVKKNRSRFPIADSFDHLDLHSSND